MNKTEFLEELSKKLSGLPKQDIEERLSFYSEMIDDRMEEGLAEENAVAEIGSPDSIASQITSETPLSKIVKENIKTRDKRKPWEIILLILGFPVWFPLLISFFAVCLSLYIVLWSLVITVYALALSFGVSALACVAAAVLLFINGRTATGIVAIGSSLILAGLCILMVILSVLTTKGMIGLTKKIPFWIKSMFVGKEKK